MANTILGDAFDTGGMRRFETGDRKEPTVYMDQNCRVYIAHVKVSGEPAIRLVLTPEAKRLAEKYKIEALLRAFR